MNIKIDDEKLREMHLNQAPSQVNVQHDFEYDLERKDDATHEGRHDFEALLDEYGIIILPYEYLTYFMENFPHEFLSILLCVCNYCYVCMFSN
jgi:hypothetical protein